MKNTEFENITFTKSLRGYNVQEVDNFKNKVIEALNELENNNKTLEEKIAFYKQQEEFLKEALISAQQTASNIKFNAEKCATDIIANAEKTATEAIKNTENETQIYRDNVYKCFYSYERELRLVIDHFYSLAKNHMQQLEKDLTQEIQTVVCRFDKDYNNLPKFNIQLDVNKNLSSNINIISTKFKEKEDSILLGRELYKNILNAEGCIVVSKGTVVTPEIITMLIGKGLYGELIEAAENKDE